MAPDLSRNPDASPAALARRPLSAGLLRSLGRAHRLVNENSRAFVLVGLFLCPSWLLAEGPYVDYSTFRQWVQLVPEVQSLEVCGLTDAAHKLWAQERLRVPATTFLQGDFSGIGRRDWIVQLHQSTSNQPCDYLLIVSHDKGSWDQLFFREIRTNIEQRWAPLWYSKKRVIAIDVGEHRRRSAPAEMSWSEGRVWSRPGFVVEDALIDTWIAWDKEQQRYEYKKGDRGEWWEIE
ncbi:MAG TPA: hypothetical protein VGR65_01340 [Casimicrobiaceae bacterium]|nr:hypothetical protein [Casimicrobiaceae bacterium]